MGLSIPAERFDVPQESLERGRAVGAAYSFLDVYDLHAPFVWRTLRRLGVGERDVEDQCQEVFLVVHRKVGGFVHEEGSTLEAWLFAICRRVASAYRRKASRKRESEPLCEGNAPVQEPQQAEALQRAEARAILDAALDELDPDKREVFVLYELERLSMPKVADLIGCPLNTAYARLYAARKIVERRARALSTPKGRPLP